MKLPDHLKLFISGTLISIIGNIVLGLINYLVRRVMAENLTQAEYGKFYGVFALISIIVAIFEFGVVNAGTVLIAENQPQRNMFFSFLLLLKLSAGIVAGGILFVFHRVIAEYFLGGNGGSLLMILSIYLLFVSAHGAFIAFYQGCKAYRSVATFRCLIFAVIFLLINLFTEKMEAEGAAWAYVIGYGIFFPIQLFWISKYAGCKFTMKFPRELPGQILKLIGIVALISFMNTLLFNMDSVMLTRICGIEETAIYNIALPITQLLLSFMVFSSVFIPLAADMVKSSKYKQLGRYVIGAISSVIICTPILYFIASSTGRYLINLLFTTSYSQEAASVLPWLFCGYFLHSAGAFIMQILIIMRCNKALCAIVFLTVTANFFLNWLLIHNWGANGAAQATFYSYLLFFITIVGTYYYHSRKKLCGKV